MTKSIRRRNYRNLIVFGLGIFTAVFLFVFLAQKFGKIEDDSSAANLANFQAGYIISDFQMINYSSMSESDIQNFLRSKGKCGNTNFSGVGTRVDYFSDHTPPTTWHVKDGHTVCLAEENMNGESAAHIIWQAAQDYHINPKVLIVLIQKETGLITDPIPNSWDYQRTAGYGCPDTAACSEKYYGFKNQIRNAAQLFRIVMDGNSSYYPIGNNNVRYSPDPSCGSSTVYIKNLATSALYRYTPYQPNAGALAAGYGTAPCGAYGNRNFYSYFEDWFGGITTGSTITEYYNEIGGEKSILGKAIDEEKCGLIRGGCYRKYEIGRIYWTLNTGSWDISGRIYDKWYAMGTEWSKLGYPTSSEKRDLKDGGAFQKFENGRIYYKKGIGAWDISGRIYDKWYAMGTEWSELGYPTSSEQKDENGVVYQQFEHGRIYYKSGKAWVIPDWGLNRYKEMGASNSILGTSVSDGKCGLTKDGCYQNFDVGRIYYTPSTGAWDISGRIYDKWYAMGTEWSELGYPTSSEQKDENGVVYQQFEHGRIYYKSGKAWVETK